MASVLMAFDPASTNFPAFLDYNNFTEYLLRYNVLLSNPDNITQLGYDFFWLGFGFQVLATFVFLYLTLFHGKAARKLHVLQLGIVGTAAVAYYAMARGQGGVPLPNDVMSGFRYFYWARYAEWAVTVPLTIYSLAVLADVRIIETTLATIVASVIMVVCGLNGALSQSSSRWGWFGLGCWGLFLTLVGLFGNIRKAAYAKSESVGFTYTYLVFLILGSWIAYPVIWVIGEGTRAVTVDVEILLYAIFDVITKVVFGFALLMSEPVHGFPNPGDLDLVKKL
eukprot:tig00000079_g2793.t1